MATIFAYKNCLYYIIDYLETNDITINIAKQNKLNSNIHFHNKLICYSENMAIHGLGQNEVGEMAKS